MSGQKAKKRKTKYPAEDECLLVRRGKDVYMFAPWALWWPENGEEFNEKIDAYIAANKDKQFTAGVNFVLFAKYSDRIVTTLGGQNHPPQNPRRRPRRPPKPRR